MQKHTQFAASFAFLAVRTLAEMCAGTAKAAAAGCWTRCCLNVAAVAAAAAAAHAAAGVLHLWTDAPF
jgi:hypothetical protein